MLKPGRIVIGAGAHEALGRAILARRPDLEVRGAKQQDITAEDLAWADTYVGFRRPRLATMGDVRWVHCTGAGVDAWLYPNELPREILLTRTSESFGPMIAEWAVARVLAFSQNILELDRAQRRHEWLARDPMLIRGTHALIVGTGDVGSHIGRALRALGCRVTGVSRSGGGGGEVFDRTTMVSSLRDVVGDANWLIVALPLTAETHGLVNAAVLSACRRAVLLNVGRGAVVEEAAIRDALDRGWLRGAALDVFEVEPLPASSPLWDDE